MKERLGIIFCIFSFVSIICLETLPAFAIGSQIGLEFAIDAPWRIEPSTDNQGKMRYGPIPIVITFHDAIFDHDRSDIKDRALDFIGLKNIHVGVLQSVSVTELTKSRSGSFQAPPTRRVSKFQPSQLTEIERKIGISKKTVEPRHAVCWPKKGMNCTGLLDITKSHEWHALLWYTPKQFVRPGDNIHLSVSVETKYHEKGRVWTNSLLVHAGEAPLPRFSNQWLYGDLHYHSQMTDNDGESAYSYRNVVRAMGALGMDFTFATDHASDGIQSDTKLSLKTFFNLPPGTPNATITGQKEARDLNPIRFGVAKSLIYGPNGANELIAEDVKTGGVASYRSHDVLPQIFMGEEVDAWPAMSANEHRTGNILFGDGLQYSWAHGRSPKDKNSCMNKAKKKRTSHERVREEQKCRNKFSKPVNVRDRRTYKPSLVLDDQGAPLREDFNEYVGDTIATLRFGNLFTDMAPNPARQHIVYFPYSTTPNNATGFVSSRTTEFGGASRQLGDVANDIHQKGVAFLAHPLASRTPGGSGPDIVPYSEYSLDIAWKSPAILGLQLWNEDNRLLSEGPEGKSRTITVGVGIGALSVKKKIGGKIVPQPVRERTLTRNRKTTSYFNYQLPWQTRFPFKWETRIDTKPYEKTPFLALYHGVYTWDKYLRKGLDSRQTRRLDWLRGGPRKWFMAGGSDAHGDLNFRREGRFLPCALENLSSWCDYPVVDTAIGKPRNLVFVGGPPTGTPAKALPNVKRYRNRHVLKALQLGRFSVTDGPALRIVVDRNRNGKIDRRDFQMGDTVHVYPGERIPLIVEWFSTPEFGPVQKVDIYVGTKDGTFVSPLHGGPQPANAQQRSPNNGYWPDPSGLLQVKLSGSAPKRLHGQVRFYVDRRDFRGMGKASSHFYLRAFAQTSPSGRCKIGNPTAGDGACIRRLAYSNPIWGKNIPTCNKDRRGIDQNGDGMPDVCENKKIPLDPCPPAGIRPNLPGPVISRSIATPQTAILTVILEQPVHFSSIDGSDVLLEPGSYQIEPAENWLKVIPQGGEPSDALLIEAVTATHAETLDSPMAVSSPGDEQDVHHLVLLLPDGKSLGASGSYSGIRTRGVFSRPKINYPRIAQTKRNVVLPTLTNGRRYSCQFVEVATP